MTVQQNLINGNHFCSHHWIGLSTLSFHILDLEFVKALKIWAKLCIRRNANSVLAEAFDSAVWQNKLNLAKVFLKLVDQNGETFLKLEAVEHVINVLSFGDLEMIKRCLKYHISKDICDKNGVLMISQAMINDDFAHKATVLVLDHFQRQKVKVSIVELNKRLEKRNFEMKEWEMNDIKKRIGSFK